MSEKKITCFWCEAEVKKQGDLCSKCQLKYDRQQEEWKQIDSDMEKIFGKNADCLSMIALVREKDQRIAELEKELAELKENSIVPKFEVGDTVYYLDEFSINKVKVLNRNIGINYDCINENIEETLITYNHCFNEGECEEIELFDTEQEAQQKLKELEETK